MITLNINGQDKQLDVEDDTPILWAVRDEAQLTGTKFGCGMALCGACTMHLDGQPIRSCSTPVSAAVGKKSPRLKRWQNMMLVKSCKPLGVISMWCNAAIVSLGKSCLPRHY